MKTKVIIAVCLSVLLQNCEYNFTPKTGNYENKLVIHGLITNELRTIEVTLSRTTKINSYVKMMETGALVSVISNLGESIYFTETADGIYSSLEPFEGKIGEEYKLIITTNDGNRYESDYVAISQANEIGELSYERKKKEIADIDNPLLGYQFYVDVNVGKNQQGLFRYEMDETWEIQMPLIANFYYPGGDPYYIPQLPDYTPVHFERTCWMYNHHNEFSILSTEQIGATHIDNFPLIYVSNETNRLRVKYCLNVKQYTLTEKTYSFWRSQFDNIGQSSMYSKQPYQVIGNIKNINDPSDVVLGIFEASGVSSKRIFVQDYTINAASGFGDCEYKTELSEGQIINGHYGFQEPFKPMKYILDADCVNCELYGAVPEKPDFWE